MPSDPACYLCGGTQLTRRAPNASYTMVVCESCGYRRQDPIPPPGALDILYHNDFYTERGLDKGIDEQPRFMRELIAERVRSVTRWRGGSGRLLDVGCGTGLFVEAAARQGWAAVGTETSAASLAYARRYTSAPIFQGELRDYQADGPFDAVTFWDVIEHLPDPRAELERAAAMLVPGGVVAISLPNVAGLKARLLGDRWRYYLPSMGHISHFSPSTLARLVGEARLELVQLDTHGAFNLWKSFGQDPLSVRESHPLLDSVQRLADAAAGRSGLGETITAYARRPAAEHG
jgi:2-polyprenyl-3-methyl-5-hydroxy-6-metoxy-1,4-benzoquinol methylase